jgi:hypothetical protein
MLLQGDYEILVVVYEQCSNIFLPHLTALESGFISNPGFQAQKRSILLSFFPMVKNIPKSKSQPP